MRSLVLAMFLGAGLAASQPAAPPSQPATPDSAEYYFLIGRYFEGAGRIDEAIAAHRRAIELEPGSAELRAELAALYARQDNAIDAIETAEGALERDPANLEANRTLGSIYAAFAERRLPIREGDDPSTYAAKAIAYLEKIDSDGLDVGVELALARLYIQTGGFEKAIPLLERVIDAQPEFAEGAFLLSTAQENAGRTSQAIETLQGVLQDNPGSFRAQVRLAELYERQQRWHEAADAYGKAQGLNPRATVLTGRRAVALLSAGRAVEARDLVQGALGTSRAAAPDPILLYLLAESQRALKELDAAQATVQKLLAASPDDTRALHVLSLIQQDKGDLTGAEKTLRDLIGRDPLDANALNTLGYMLADRGERLNEAVELIQRALKIEPGNPSYLDSLGWAYFQQGRIDLADSPLTEAAANLSTNSVVQDHLGDLRFKQQRYGDAADAWGRALAGDGQSIDKSKIEKKIRDARGRM